MSHHRIFLLILLCFLCSPNRSIAAGDTPFSKICDPANGCDVWTIKSMYFEGEEGRTCKTIADTRCHPCWRSNGKKQCAPIVANVTIQGHNIQEANGRTKNIGTNSFYVTCTGDVGPEVTPQPSNESYPLDKRMFDVSFNPQEKTVYYNLWWAVCRNHSQKFGLAETGTPPPAKTRQAEPDRTLIDMWLESNNSCRGGRGDSPKTEAACGERERIGARLEKLGNCYGRKGEIGAEMVWHKCGKGSHRSESADGNNPWTGRWFTGNVKVCKGNPGESEGLITYTLKLATGLENICKITKIAPRGVGVDILLRCAGEGMEYSEKEYLEVQNGKLLRTVFEGKRKSTFSYDRCPE